LRGAGVVGGGFRILTDAPPTPPPTRSARSGFALLSLAPFAPAGKGAERFRSEIRQAFQAQFPLETSRDGGKRGGQIHCAWKRPSTIQAHSSKMLAALRVGDSDSDGREFAGRVKVSGMKKTAPPPADDWQRNLELERFRLERSLAEDRRTEIVARLAIDLARARGGRPRKGGGSIIPDIEGAVRLLEEARTARQIEKTKPPQEVFESGASSFLDGESLRWHIAKRGAAPGSGGVVSAMVLCDKSRPPDFKIHVGFYRRGEWVAVHRWEVLRNTDLFRRIAEAAYIDCLSKTPRRPKEKTPSVTASHIDEVLNLPELNLDFFKALVAARKELEKQRKSASAGGEPKVPRGKSAGWKK